MSQTSFAQAEHVCQSRTDGHAVAPSIARETAAHELSCVTRILRGAGALDHRCFEVPTAVNSLLYFAAYFSVKRQSKWEPNSAGTRVLLRWRRPSGTTRLILAAEEDLACTAKKRAGRFASVLHVASPVFGKNRLAGVALQFGLICHSQ